MSGHGTADSRALALGPARGRRQGPGGEPGRGGPGQETWPPPTGPVDARRLFTPGEAAALLTVPESWLRRKAGRRLIPCTFLGKHLRFSPADVTAIALAGAQVPRQPRDRMRYR